MSPVTATFLGIGGFSILLLLLALLGAGHLHLPFGVHLHLGSVHIGHPGAEGSGSALSGAAIAAGLGGFGFGGAIAAELLPGRSGDLPAALVGGVVLGLVAGVLGGRLTRAAMTMSTDATPESRDLVGATGVVVDAIPAGGYGAVRLLVAGAQVRFNARSDHPLDRGTPVFVVQVPTATSVIVEETLALPDQT